MYPQVPVDPAGTQHGSGQPKGDRLLCINETYSLRARLKDLIACDQPLQFTHILFKLIQVRFALSQPALREIVQHTANTEIVHVKPAASQCFEKRQDALAIAEGPEQWRRRTQIIDISSGRDQVAGDALQFSDKQADVLGPSWGFDLHQLLDGSGVCNFVEHGREVVDIVHIPNASHHRAILHEMQNDGLTSHLFSAYPQSLFLDFFTQLEHAFDQGFWTGGQPGTYTSTGTMVSTPWIV